VENKSQLEEEIAAKAGIEQLARAFRSSRVLLTALELGVFGVLAPGEMSSAAVARALGTDARATDRLLNALVALGFLSKTADRFSNCPLAQRFLVPGQPDYLASLHHIAHLWDSWSTLTQAVRAGKSVLPPLAAEQEAEWTRAFIEAMHEFACERIPHVLPLIDFTGVERVLDVGGGSGAYSIAFARAYPQIRVVVFDLPRVVPLAARYIQQAGLSERVRIEAGDFLQADLGTGFDLAFISAVIHSNSPQQNLALLARTHRTLVAGGQVVIQDFIMEESRTEPEAGTLFALNMLVQTAAGDTYTEGEVRGWLEETGFHSVRRQDTGTGTTLISARK